jgi:hypothetical protein
MEPKDMFKGLSKIGRKLRESGLGDAADAVISISPAGGYWNIIKGAAKVLGISKGADADVIADALETATPDQKAKIAELIVREKEAEFADAANERDNVTARHAADMMGDSKLSKNWRPVVGYIVVGAFLADQIAWRVLTSLEKPAERGELIADVAVTVLGFYYGSRGLQHVGSYFASKWSGNIGK